MASPAATGITPCPLTGSCMQSQEQAAFDCEDGGSSLHKSAGRRMLSRRQDCSTYCTISFAFGAAAMMGFFALGPLLKSAVVDSQATNDVHSQVMGKAFSVTPSALRLPRRSSPTATKVSNIRMGFFDIFKESEEQKANKQRQYEVQQEILERRRNPEALKAYYKDMEKRRENQDIEASREEKRDTGSSQLGPSAKWLEDTINSGMKNLLDGADGKMSKVERQAEAIDEEDSADESKPDIFGGLNKLFGGK